MEHSGVYEDAIDKLEQRINDLEAELALLCDKLGVKFTDETRNH
jgi:hypothetical protein